MPYSYSHHRNTIQTRRCRLLCALLTLAVSAPAALAVEAEPTPVNASLNDFHEPDPAVTALLTAQPPPEVITHARSAQIALAYREPVVPIARLGRDRLGLAGFLFDPEWGVSNFSAGIRTIEILSADPSRGRERVSWQPPEGAVFEFPLFSPDGRFLSALTLGDRGTRLALFDIRSGSERILELAVNAAWGNPCSWVDNGDLLCRVMPPERGPEPAARPAPTLVEHEGDALPLRTYSNLLENDYEDALFEYHFSSALARVAADGSTRPLAGPGGLIKSFDPSPDGRFATVTRLQRPFSRLAPASRFPSVVEVWDLATGERLYAAPARGIGVKEEGDGDYPRRGEWMPGSSSTIGFILSPQPDSETGSYQWFANEPPFTGSPRLVASSPAPIRDFGWTTRGTPWFTTRGKTKEEIEAYVVFEDGPKLLWSGSVASGYENPGRAIRADGSNGPVLESSGRIFIAGDGQGERGPTPFMDQVDLRLGTSHRLFSARPGEFEAVLAVLDGESPAWITSHETESEPPRLFLHRGGERTPLTERQDFYPQLAGTTRQVVQYRRTDGLALSGTLYLPAGRADGEALPTLIWIYPYEYSDREQAEQLDIRAFRYHRVKGPSPLAAVVAGYAVLVNPSVPIVHDEGEMNDQYLPQLVASVEAAVDHLVGSGVTDPTRVAVGGRSYGAFSAANLLIHSDRFATAIAMSGAYNRTLTPFGFQHEKRSFWEATELYTSVSPFFFANQVKRPILLVHGGADENPGTPTFQGRRFFHALVGAGATARYVELPFEGHHYWARENVLLAAAEMVEWLDRFMDPSRDTGPGGN